MKWLAAWFVFLGIAPWGRALPPTDYFEPDLTLYCLTDLLVVRPLDLAMLPLTTSTFAVSVPVTAGSGSDAVARSYEILVGDVSQHLMARPLGSFFDWDNRDKTRPVVVQFPDSYTVAYLSPQQERRYRATLKEHKETMEAIRKEPGLPEGARQALVAAEERRWENVLRLLLSL